MADIDPRKTTAEPDESLDWLKRSTPEREREKEEIKKAQQQVLDQMKQQRK